MTATKAPSKTTKKHAKGAKGDDAVRRERMRRAVIKEIGERIAKGENAQDGPLHEGLVTRGDGNVVKVSVPRDEPEALIETPTPTGHSEQGAPTDAPAKPKKPKAEKAPKPPKEKKPKRLSALDAAAQVLAESGKPMRAIDLIAEMQKQGLWSSPKGRTPEASLYAALIREIAAKKAASRFAKHDKGLFIANTAAPR